jgi:hypothetical protein
MRVVQLFAEQDVLSLHRTLLDVMESDKTDEVTTCTKGEVSIVRTKMRESVKGKTVHGDRDESREHGALIKHEPMGIMVIGHWRLNSSETSPIDSFLYTLKSVKEVSLSVCGQTKDKTNGVKGMYMGSMKTIENDKGHPGIGSNQIPTIQSLSKTPSIKTPIPIKLDTYWNVR